MKLRNKLLTFLLASGMILATPKIAKSISVSSYIHHSSNNVPSQNSIVQYFTANSDTMESTVNNNQRYFFDTNNLTPPPSVGEKLFIKISKDTLGRIFNSKTNHILKASNNFPLELHLDDPFNSPLAFTPNISVVKDTSGISTSFVALAKLYKNLQQPCIGIIDTSASTIHRYDSYFNLEKQDSTFAHGDSFKIRLEKSRNDSTWFTEISSAIDTTVWDAMKVNEFNSIHNGAFHGDTLYFPQNVSVFKDLQIDSVWTTTAVNDSVYPKALVKNNRTVLSDSSKYYFTITENGSPFYADSLDKKLLAGQRDTITFSACPQGGNFAHVLQCSTSTDGDATPNNNTKQKTISGPMAVELSYFGAMPYDKGIRLEWMTESSLNSFLWEIYRGQSNDTLKYDLIGTQPGDGNSNQPRHYYHDDKCVEGLNWYKLGEVGFSGEKTFYGPINAFARTNGALREGEFRAYPNPIKRLIDLKVDKAGDYVLYNVLGQELGKITKRVDGGSSSNINGKHPAGIYFIKKEESGETKKIHVVK